MDIDPTSMNPITKDYLKKVDEQSSRNVVLSTWEKKYQEHKKMKEFEEIECLVNTAREVYINTNKSMSELIGELNESLNVLRNKLTNN